MVHLSRLAEELTWWSNPRFGFVRLSDAFSTGSSMMPNKKNPDPAELVRGRTGRVIGALAGVLVLLKGLPLAYQRDLQEDKPPLFESVATFGASLRILAGLLDTLGVDRAAMRAAADEGYITATATADALVRLGLPFRVAHRVVGALVGGAEAAGIGLAELRRSGISDALAAADDLAAGALAADPATPGRVRAAADVEAALAACDVIGGTAPERVSEAIATARRRLGRERRAARHRADPARAEGPPPRSPRRRPAAADDHRAGGRAGLRRPAVDRPRPARRVVRAGATRARSSSTSRRSSRPSAVLQTPRRPGPGRGRVRRGPGRRRRRLRRGPPCARAVDPRRAVARRGRRGDPRRLPDRRRTSGRRPADRHPLPGHRDAPGRPGGARSPSSPCVTATAGSSASTSPVRRRATRRAASRDVFQRLVHANFHLTLHAGEGYGLPSIREALDLGAERLGHGVRIVDDISDRSDRPVASSGGSPPTSAIGGSRSSCARPRTSTPGRRRRSPSIRSTCFAGCASG